MDQTPTSSQKKRAKRMEAPRDDMDDDVDEELVGWPTSSTSTSTSKKSKKRKSDAGRSLTRERSTSTRAASAETVQRGESRAAEGPGPEQKDDVSDQDDDDAESDGADGEALAEDEFSRQQAIYAAQQRNMGYVAFVSDLHVACFRISWTTSS